MLRRRVQALAATRVRRLGSGAARDSPRLPGEASSSTGNGLPPASLRVVASGEMFPRVTRSRKRIEGWKTGAARAGTSTGSPVLELRAVRALQCRTLKVPNPRISMPSPRSSGPSRHVIADAGKLPVQLAATALASLSLVSSRAATASASCSNLVGAHWVLRRSRMAYSDFGVGRFFGSSGNILPDRLMPSRDIKPFLGTIACLVKEGAGGSLSSDLSPAERGNMRVLPIGMGNDGALGRCMVGAGGRASASLSVAAAGHRH